jgi:hypothetical protein
MFRAKKEASVEVAEVFAVKSFLWQFLLHWKKAGSTANDAFLTEQRRTLAKWGGTQPSETLAPAPQAANSEVDAMASGAGQGPTEPQAIPAQAASATLTTGRPAKLPRRKPAMAPAGIESALPQPAGTMHSQGVHPQPATMQVALEPAPPVAPVGTKPEASKRPQKRRRQRDEDDCETDQRAQDTDHVEQTDEGKKRRRREPQRGDTLHDVPCDRCARLNYECWVQAGGSPACWRCGKNKSKCERNGEGVKRVWAKSKRRINRQSESGSEYNGDEDQRPPARKRTARKAQVGGPEAGSALASAPAPAAQPTIGSSAMAQTQPAPATKATGRFSRQAKGKWRGKYLTTWPGSYLLNIFPMKKTRVVG